jgi:hypothetical protein
VADLAEPKYRTGTRSVLTYINRNCDSLALLLKALLLKALLPEGVVAGGRCCRRALLPEGVVAE